MKLLSLITITIFISGCGMFAKATPLPDCDVSLKQLTLEESDFPDSWSKGEAKEADQYSGGAIDSCNVSFYVLNGTANQGIYLYEDEDGAIHGYSSLLEAFAWKDTKIVSAPSYTSTIADDYYLECAVPRDRQICEVLARYKQFTVVFTTHINPSFMTYSDFEKILRTIDRKMSSGMIQ